MKRFFVMFLFLCVLANAYALSDKCITIWSDRAFYELKNELEYVPEYVCGFDEEGIEVFA